MNYSLLKVGSIVEATFEDTVLCGIVIKLDEVDLANFLTDKTISFKLRVLFDLGEGKSKSVLIDSAALTFIAPLAPDFYAIIDGAKSESMRWVFIRGSEMTDPLTFEEATVDDDGLSYKDSDKARLKFMYLNEIFDLDFDNGEVWKVERVA